MWSEARKSVVSPGCHIRFTKYALLAADLRMAEGIPSTSRFGITLVNSDPGPSVTASASAMALKAASSGRTLRGIRRMRLILCRLRLMRVSPTTPPRAVRQRGFNGHVRGGRGIDAARDLEHFRRNFHRSRKVAHDLRQGRQEQVAEAVSLEPPAGLEPVLEEPGKQTGILAQRHHAVADIARRQHVEFPAQAAR